VEQSSTIKYFIKVEFFLELHPELVFFGQYRSVFLGMYDTITEGNLGQYVCSRGTYIGMTPFRECPEL